MNPLDKIAAGAARIFQESESMHGQTQIRIREAVAQIRGGLATLRQALDMPAGKPARLQLILGDETPLPGVAE